MDGGVEKRMKLEQFGCGSAQMRPEAMNADAHAVARAWSRARAGTEARVRADKGDVEDAGGTAADRRAGSGRRA